MDNIQTVSCTGGDISLKWKNEQAYNMATSSWNWVNQAQDRYLIVVTNTDSCGGHRQPYKIQNYKANQGSLSMQMMGSAVDFKDAFPVMKLEIDTQGVAGQNTTTGLNKRVSVDHDFDLSHDFGGTSIFSKSIADGLDVSLTCGTCNTAGSLHIHADASVSIFSSPHFDASVTLTPTGVAATVGLDLVVTGTLTDAVDESVTFLNVPLGDPFAIPAVGQIGPSLMVNMDLNIDSVTASVDLKLGSVTLSIDDSSSATVDLVDSSKDSITGFNPQFSTEGPSINAGISAHGSFGPNIVLGFDAELLGTGAAVGLALAAPTLEANAAFNPDNCQGGVEFDAGVSAQLNAFAGIGKVAEVADASTISIIGTSTQLFSTCLTLPTDAAAPAPAATTPATTPSGPTGGVVGSTLSGAGCQAIAGASASAPDICAADGGDASLTTTCDGFANICCPAGTACQVLTDSSGVSGNCCV